MDELTSKFKKFTEDLIKTKNFFLESISHIKSSVHIYTHLDADGLAAGAILGKSLCRESIPFQIKILRQLERNEIVKIKELIEKYNPLVIFSDFGSGQYLELIELLDQAKEFNSFIILDHHLPQNISDKDDGTLHEIYEKTRPWHINPYFYNFDGSIEISGSGLSYFFAKTLNDKNVNLAPIALVGATGDIQNQGQRKSFTGLNSIILKDAMLQDLIEVVDDLNFSAIKPLHEAIAYSSDIDIPGLTGNPNNTLIFLQKLGILMENANGNIRSLNDLSQTEKQKVNSAVIRYISLKLNLDPNKILDKLIIKRYLLKNETKGSELHDLNDFSYLLNSCGRTDNGGLGIGVAMGDRNKALQKARENLILYKKSLSDALNWIYENNKIQKKQYLQYFFGENIIPENIVGTICSMLINEKGDIIDKFKPLFGLAKREKEDVYKVSARASKKLVKEGLNLSEVIRTALKLSELEVLGGGHPPAAGTKIPIKKANEFLENCDIIIKNQLNL